MPLVKPAWLTLMVTVPGRGTPVRPVMYERNLKTFNSAITTSGVSTGASSAAIVRMMSVPITVFIINQSKIVETMASSGMKD